MTFWLIGGDKRDRTADLLAASQMLSQPHGCAVCFCKPRFRVFRYRNCPFTTPKTCSALARIEDFSCSLRLSCPCDLADCFFICEGRRLSLYRIRLPDLFFVTASSRLSAPRYPLSPYTTASSPVSSWEVMVTSWTFADFTSIV